MRKFLLLFLFIICINSLSSLCSEGQININNAVATELDKLSGIGEAKAQAIISSRPFESVDNLIDVSGIGEITLEKIKTQGLACVDSEDNPVVTPEEQEEEKEENSASIENKKVEEGIKEPVEVVPEKTVITQTINLAPQNIKSKKNDVELNSPGKYAIYGLVSFCVLLFGLFIIKRTKIKEDKNEFDN